MKIATVTGVGVSLADKCGDGRGDAEDDVSLGEKWGEGRGEAEFTGVGVSLIEELEFCLAGITSLERCSNGQHHFSN